MIKAVIHGPGNGLEAEVVNGTEENALVVATRPLKAYANTVKFFTNATYGANMNVDASTGGVPVPVHDGEDTSLWSATDIVGGGKTTFNSTDQAHTGTRSIKIDNSPVNDVFQLDKGSDLDCTGYVSVTMWLYVDKDWKAGDDILLFGWDTGLGSQVGSSVGIQDYFDFSSFDVWQKATIPLSDMGSLANSTTLDSLRVRIAASEGKSPKFYIDDIQFEETGEPVRFSLRPAIETWLHVKEFMFTFVDNIPGTLADATGPYLAYNKFLGVTVPGGVVYQREQSSKVVFSQTLSSLVDIMQLAGSEISGYGSDGTNTWVTVRSQHMEPIILKAENDDELSFTVSDDLSGLLSFRVSAGCGIEERQ